MTLIAIAGAGIAGLTAALALARTGVDVVMMDAAGRLSEAGAGVQLSPNATRVLADLGVLAAIAARGVRPESIRLRRARDGAVLAALPLGAAAERRYGAPFLVAHRADLQAVLLEAVLAEPRISLTTNMRLDAVEADAGEVTMITERGDRLRAEGLVGADGVHSAVRRFVAAGVLDPLRFSGRTAWRSVVPATAAPPHAREPASNLWLGSGAHLVHYPVRGGSLINVVAIIEGAWHGRDDADDWAAPGDAGQLMTAFGDWHPEARALLEAAPDWRVWPLVDRKALPQWSRGPVTLAGDAAHPMLPFLAQGAAQAIEDGWAIARAMEAAPTFARAAVAYERTRRPKAERVQRESRRQATIYHLAPPASLARDAAFRVLGAQRMLARYDWLYGRRPTAVT